MPGSFRISYRWVPRQEPSYLPEFVDATPLFICLMRFISLHEGQFELHLGDDTLEFSFGPDLSSVFEELPDVLEALTSSSKYLVELYFFEQGTGLALLMEREGGVIEVKPELRSDASPSFLA